MTDKLKANSTSRPDPLRLGIFSSRVASIAEEMGEVLRRASFSANIKDRLDYSCALFDAKGRLVAQAAHIPVHLGSMAYAMSDLVKVRRWVEGDTLVVNDPFNGGTHLPDVTLISPVFLQDSFLGFVANRAHHADIGSAAPGSMPLSCKLEEEGIIIPPTLLATGGKIIETVFDELTSSLGENSRGDFVAQWSANRRGVARLNELVEGLGLANYLQSVEDLNTYARELAGLSFAKLPEGKYEFEDYLDDDGQGTEHIRLKASIDIQQGNLCVDFTGTQSEVQGNLNCPITVTAAAVLYVFRCLLPADAPACHGLFERVSIVAPKQSLVNASNPSAVAAGNVETSQRIVDLIIGALAKAVPELMPAASQGTMNNLAMGSNLTAGRKGDADYCAPWSYYETICGGTGAHNSCAGLDAVQSHMTNTLNTPIEVLEKDFPLRLRRYQLRPSSGGEGVTKGGLGVIREYEFLDNTQVSLITERRLQAPWGAQGGGSGLSGANYLNGKEMRGKCQLELEAGDRLRIESPGGGGFGKAQS